MDLRNLFNATSASIMAILTDMYERLIPFMLLSFIIIVVDTKFGIDAARHRHEDIRFYRMFKGMMNKFFDYLLWVTLAGIFGHIFGDILGIPILSMLLLLVIYGIEITSCLNNYFEAKGIKKKFNVFKLIKPEINDAFEDVHEHEHKEHNDEH